MRKLLANSLTIVCVALACGACGRNSNPVAPTRIATVPGTQNPASPQSIQISGDGADRTVAIGQTVQLRAVARWLDGTEEDITTLATWDVCAIKGGRTAHDGAVPKIPPQSATPAIAISWRSQKRGAGHGHHSGR